MATALAQERAQLRMLARSALVAYGMPGATLRLLRHRQKAVYRVQVGPLVAALRLERASRYPPEVLRAELAWLAVLSRQASLPVTTALPATDGSSFVTLADPASGEHWRAVLLRWVVGQPRARRLSLGDAGRLGALLGTLHGFASREADPARYPRWDYDWGEIFGADAPVWRAGADRYGAADFACFMTAAERVRAACAALGSGPAVYGLIHGDVNLTNVRFGPEGPALIDFNDCGYGYYLWDVARALLHLRELGPRGAGLREALLAGYARSFPVGAAAYAYLPAFEAMNVVDIVNWLLGLAEAPPWKAAYLRAAPALLHLILGGKQAA